MNIYARLFSYVPEKKTGPYMAMLLAGLGAILSAYSLFLVYKFLVSLLIQGNLSIALDIAIRCMVCLSLGGILYFVGVCVAHDFAFRLETNLKKKGLEGISNASFAFFDKNDSGRVRRIIDDNSSQTHTIVAHMLPDITNAFATLFMLLILGFFVKWQIGLTVLVLFLIALFFSYEMMGKADFMSQYLKSLEEMNGEAVGYVRGMQVIKTFNANVKSMARLYELIHDYSDLAYRYTLSCRPWWCAFKVLFIAFPSISALWGVFAVASGQDAMSVLVDVLVLTLISGSLFICIMKCMFVGSAVTTATNCMDKLEALYDEMQQDKIVHGSLAEFDNFNIEFRDVSFGYTDDLILDKFNLKLNQGKVYALVGPSGSGKTTIANLISGFYKVNGGSVLIGDKPISNYSEVALNDHVATVFQNSKLFNKSIYENVLVGNPDATHEMVMEAMDKAGCMPIINALKDKENSVVGSKGVYLSGGEIQRIAIARAILKNADIIILDEASAATDPMCEYEILQAFKNLIENKTVIIIAHRLTTIKGVDEILVVEDGQVIERGSDSELISSDTTYKRIQQLYAQANDWQVKND